MEQHDLADILSVTPVFLFLLGVGVVLMFFPGRIQRLAAMDRWGPFVLRTLRWRFMRTYIESPAYIWHLRFIGACALIFAAVVLYAAVCS